MIWPFNELQTPPGLRKPAHLQSRGSRATPNLSASISIYLQHEPIPLICIFACSTDLSLNSFNSWASWSSQNVLYFGLSVHRSNANAVSRCLSWSVRINSFTRLNASPLQPLEAQGGPSKLTDSDSTVCGTGFIASWGWGWQRCSGVGENVFLNSVNHPWQQGALWNRDSLLSSSAMTHVRSSGSA